MKPLFAAAAIAALTLPLLYSCRTTEANYRQAYEKTMQARQEQAALDSTIYGAHRRAMGTVAVTTPDGEVTVRTQLVRLTGDTPREKLHRYNVVVGQFKQLFNASSLRDRLADAGYPAAFVVETAEPYYYIVAASVDDVASAKRELDAFVSKSPIALKEPCPFILDATAKRTK